MRSSSPRTASSPAIVNACRRQIGCMRFCYVPPGSRTPRRYHCQPDLVERAVADLFAKSAITPAERDELIESERLRVEPRVQQHALRRAAYCQLAATCAVEIARGADDESEMGVFHDLFQPQRAANLRTRPRRIHAGRHQRRHHLRYLGESHRESRPHPYNLQPAQALQPRARAAGARSARCRLERAIVDHALSAAAARRRRHWARRGTGRQSGLRARPARPGDRVECRRLRHRGGALLRRRHPLRGRCRVAAGNLCRHQDQGAALRPVGRWTASSPQPVCRPGRCRSGLEGRAGAGANCRHRPWSAFSP